jgi:hypothetical protein
MAKSRSRSKSPSKPASKSAPQTVSASAPSSASPVPQAMSASAPTTPAPARGHRIVWPHVATVISATILIGAEVFGAAFAGSWALATLFGLGFYGARVLDVLLMLCGLAVMVQFVRSAHLIEPFTARG